MSTSPATPSTAPTRAAIVRMALVGCACAWGGVVSGAMALWYLALMPFRLGAMNVVSWLGLLGGVLVTIVATYQAAIWIREWRGGRAQSRRLAWLGYPAALLAVICWAVAYGTAGWKTPLGLMCGAAAVGALLGQVLAGVQHLRDPAEPPSTLGAAVRGAVARSNAKADAELDRLSPSPTESHDEESPA